MNEHRVIKKEGVEVLAKFNEKAQKVIAVAESIAFDLGHSSVGTEHLLLALLKVKESKLRSILNDQEITFDYVKEEIIRLFGEKDSQPFYMEYTPSLKRIMEQAIIESKKYGEERVSIDVLTFCLLDSADNVASEILKQAKVDAKQIKDEMSRTFKKVSELDNLDDLVNLNRFSEKNHIPLIGRKLELEQLMETLLRKNKPNAILIGEAGVGKTALVYELAYLLSQDCVPHKLKNKTIYELDIAGVVAGTKYRGEFEDKLKKIIHKVKEDRNCIVFIDEIHNIIGAGGAEGAIDASNILKPYLSRGEIQCIGATTYDEYVKLFEKEKALERRFQLLPIEEPSVNETITILTETIDSYRKFHQIDIDVSLIPPLVNFCQIYIGNKFFPDKAIDVLDCACVKGYQKGKKELELSDIIQTIEENYKVHVVKDEKAAALQTYLNERILGQQLPINKIVNQIRSIEAGLVEDNRPLGVYLFVGPTGVGKTEVAKQIAKSYFGDERKLIKVDMAEFMSKESITKLLGSPPGYVGFDQQSHLVESLRKNPHAVILLDEVEKAHRDILDVFLNVFDEGYFIDASKRKVNFCNSIIVLTSNLGYSEDLFHKEGLGFVKAKASNEEITKALNLHFRPEFLNRIDEVIYFNELSKETGEKLATQYLKEFCQKINMETGRFDDEIDDILRASKLGSYGARGIRREVRRRISQQIDAKSSSKIKLF